MRLIDKDRQHTEMVKKKEKKRRPPTPVKLKRQIRKKVEKKKKKEPNLLILGPLKTCSSQGDPCLPFQLIAFDVNHSFLRTVTWTEDLRVYGFALD